MLLIERRGDALPAKRTKMTLKILLLVALMGSIAAGSRFNGLFGSAERKTG
ncbi:MAG TPA: hypothetical protein VKC16_09350 [Xanthobacteraceae bacterium]|nr:hypothetical protein [Xanthobacteraceae bacterium]